MARLTLFQYAARYCIGHLHMRAPTLIVRPMLAAALAVIMVGCGPVRGRPDSRELEWHPPQLAIQNCPDLSGRYVAPSAETYHYVFPYHGRVEKRLFPTPQALDRDKGLAITLTISSRPDGIRIKADNGNNQVDTFTPYDGRQFGCDEGRLINRFRGFPLDAEGFGQCAAKRRGGEYYGEYFYSLTPQGDIVVRRDRRLLCDRDFSTRVLPVEDAYSKEGPLIFRRVGPR